MPDERSSLEFVVKYQQIEQLLNQVIAESKRDPSEKITVDQFVAETKAILEDLKSRGKLLDNNMLAELHRATLQREQDLEFEIKAARSTEEKPATSTEPVVPPTAACFLLDLFLSRADALAILGDIVEELPAKVAQYHPWGARVWFWSETMRAIVRHNPICRWLLISGLLRLGKWIFGSGAAE